MRDDFIRSVRTCSIANDMNATAEAKLECEPRQQFGGQRHYIAKTTRRDRSDQRQRGATGAGDTRTPA